MFFGQFQINKDVEMAADQIRKKKSKSNNYVIFRYADLSPKTHNHNDL